MLIGKADLVVYQPATGYWYIRLSSTNYASGARYQSGLPGFHCPLILTETGARFWSVVGSLR